MLGNIGQIASLLKNSGKIRERVEEVKRRLDEARFEGEAGAGQVRAIVDGKGELMRLTLEPQLVADGDRELIEELVVAAVRSAVVKSREGAQREMQAAANELGLPALPDMFG